MLQPLLIKDRFLKILGQNNTSDKVKTTLGIGLIGDETDFDLDLYMALTVKLVILELL